jgi:hypothetical protein
MFHYIAIGVIQEKFSNHTSNKTNMIVYLVILELVTFSLGRAYGLAPNPYSIFN